MYQNTIPANSLAYRRKLVAGEIDVKAESEKFERTSSPEEKTRENGNPEP